MVLFAEKVVLAAVVPVLALLMANPMKFDTTQLISVAIATLAIGYFVAHTLEKRGGAPTPLDPAPASPVLGAAPALTASPNKQETGFSQAKPSNSSADRHISKDQIEQMKRALLPFPPTKIGIVTLKDRPERSTYAGELASAFRQAGWAPIRDPKLDRDDFRLDRDGVLLVSHSQHNMPELRPLIAVFTAASIDYTIVDVGDPQGGQVYMGEITTDIPVVFIGSRP